MKRLDGNKLVKHGVNVLTQDPVPLSLDTYHKMWARHIDAGGVALAIRMRTCLMASLNGYLSPGVLVVNGHHSMICF